VSVQLSVCAELVQTRHRLLGRHGYRLAGRLAMRCTVAMRYM